MSLIKVGERVFNLNAIESIDLGFVQAMDGTPINRVEIKFLSGNSMTFGDQEADTVREHFTISRDVNDLMMPQRPKDR